jgi:hypothetical protein
MTETSRAGSGRGWQTVVCACLAGISLASLAQTTTASGPSLQGTSSAGRADLPEWSRLTTRQQQALRPLAKAWPQLTSSQRQKWLALAQTYDSLTPAEQVTVHQRMAEWASLSVQERARARLNYTHLKPLGREELKAQWEAYQALTDDERKRLQQQRPAPKSAAPVSRALTAKSERLVQPPVKSGSSTTNPSIDPKTLLPRVNETLTASPPAPTQAEASAVTESASE